MSKKQFKSQASSSRAVSGAFGTPERSFGAPSAFGAVSSSPLSYVYEPPDLSGISDPNMVVAFKNLQKKDSTTKAKALEDLHANALSIGVDAGGMEDTILETWIKIYPRTSIDSARRVRQLAHLLQGQLSVSCGKRILKYMPKVVGPWLAGLYDNDKTVIRAAQESFKQVFPSEEKMRNVWKVFHLSVLEYSRDAVLKETVYTLSDERTTSPDDAAAKYARMAGTAISLVTHIMDNMPPEEFRKQQSTYHGFLSQEKVWALASDSDAFVRRALYRLLVVTLIKQSDALNMKTISTSILTSSLNHDQAGSSLDYVKALSLLTLKFPEVWTEYYSGSGKSSATRKLCQFLRRGSQGGPVDYWAQVTAMLSHVPMMILNPSSADEAGKMSEDSLEPHSPILDALHTGLIHKDEPRSNQNAAWNTYLDMADLLQSSMLGETTRYQHFKTSVLPLISQYIRPLNTQSKWTIAGPQQQSICVKAFLQILQGAQEMLRDEWQNISSMIVQDLQTSLPEQSKDYAKSQLSIAAQVDRWYSLQAAILKVGISDRIQDLFSGTSSSEVNSAIYILKTRNGKPYGAGAALERAARLIPEVILVNNDSKDSLMDFAREDIPNLLLSPSAPYLVDLLNSLEGVVDVREIYRSSVQCLLEAPESAARGNALKSLVSSSYLAQSAGIEELPLVVQRNLEHAMNGNNNSWYLVNAAIANPLASTDLTDRLLATMTDALSIEDRTMAGLHGLELAVKHNGQAVKTFSTSANGSSLLSKLLFLTESPEDEISLQARNISTAIEAVFSDEKGSSKGARSMIEIINKGIDGVEKTSLSIDSLVDQAQKLMQQASGDEKIAMAAELLPDLTQWSAVLDPLLQRSPNVSLAITNTLGCALYMIEQPSSSHDVAAHIISWDADGYSSGLRMAWYTTKMMKSTNILDLISPGQHVTTCQSLMLIVQLVSDNLSVPGSNGLWDHNKLDVEPEIVDFVSELQGLLLSWLQSASQSKSSLITEVQGNLLRGSRGYSTASYYSARAYSTITEELLETSHGLINSDNEVDHLKAIRRGPDIFASSAFLTTVPESNALLRLRNELFADLTGKDFGKETREGLRQLVLLNCIIQRPDVLTTEVPQQRLVFFVKHLASQVQGGYATLPVKTETMKALTTVLPLIKDIYGSFWAEIIETMKNMWFFSEEIEDSDIPALYASLRQFRSLRELIMLESNDDLQDSWLDHIESMTRGLLGLLKELQDTPDESHQPRKMVNSLLARQLASLSPTSGDNSTDLYSVLGSESVALQESAYEIMHRHILGTQEQISLDKALSKTFTAKLPEKLLSLILAAPTIDSIADSTFERSVPSSLRGYLLSWKLVFDHWTNSSYKVKADYVDCLKDGTYLKGLLDFTFDFLINARSKPVDASKFDIETYTPDREESPEKDSQWLLINLYYLCLKHLPTLSKTWWRDCSSRPTVIAVEAWTGKYISPLVIASELKTISTWAPTQPSTPQPLLLKVLPKAHEITAAIPIDDQEMQIAIRLPPTYPLHQATVEGISRVGVDEKKWRSWLITTQAVINFSNGSLIDGLLAWKKNVMARLEGQSECAICYSVVSADKQLPSKRCGTCKNLFHSSCLFRWFKSSNSSSCPLCRNAFNYG